MLKEINDKDKLLKLKDMLDEFLNVYDCKHLGCNECHHKKLCGNIYRLNTTLNMEYLKEKEVLNKIKVDRETLIHCMVENQDCEIAVLRDIDTEEIEFIGCKSGWLDTYCQQNRKKIIERFSHNPNDRGYDSEENKYIDADADIDLDNLDFEHIELI